MRLSEATIEQRVKVLSIDCNLLRGRLYSFGIAKDSIIKVEAISLSKHTMEISVDSNSLVGIRFGEAGNIIVQEASDEEIDHIEKHLLRTVDKKPRKRLSTSGENEDRECCKVAKSKRIKMIEEDSVIKVVLAGQANVGKSSIINAITDSKLRVGNFSGVTVEKTEVCFGHHSHKIEIVDLPGTYSLNGDSGDEKITTQYLKENEYEIVVNVIDATNLTRNLLLSLELLNLNKKIVIALNMYDEAKKENIDIDVDSLEAILGVPVVACSATTGYGMDMLLDKIHDLHDNKTREKSNISYSNIVEEAIFILEKFLSQKKYKYKDLSSREVAINLLLEENNFYKNIHDKQIFIEINPLIVSGLKNIYGYYEENNIPIIKQQENISIAKGIVAEVVKAHSKTYKSITKKIDDILINKFFGIPIFLFFMWSLFQLTFTLGAIPMDWIDAGVSWFGDAVGQSIQNDALRSLVVEGIIAGVGAVLLFLPNIIILYIGIALIETTGYMSRVAFLLDGFFHKFGLHGKSFIPLVTGFGCSVPAYMSARILKNKKDRLITLFIIGFMSCGAKLPIYVLFAGAFFAQENAGNALFIIYIVGAFFGLVMAKVLRIFVFKSEDEPFVMEMPKYRMPTFRLIYRIVFQKGKSYIKKAGTFILAATIIIWFASSYPKSDTNDRYTQLENSYLGQIGKASEPFFSPLGFDWRLSVALETGLAAKEVVVATLGILYNVGENLDETSDKLLHAIKKEVPFPSAISFIVFVMIYLPCFAASMVFAREAGGYKYLWYLFVFTTVVAWIMSFLAYNIALLFSG